MKSHLSETREIINLGEPICEKIKQIYFPVAPHSGCYNEIGAKFTDLKKIARKFFSGKTEKEMLIELGRFSKEDIEDMFHVERGDVI